MIEQKEMKATDKTLAAELQQKIDNLNKPKGSLGKLESLALQIGLIQHTLSPRLTNPCHILFGGDHGIEREGVSLSPREVTWQQMINYGHGGGGVNMFCRQHGFDLKVVDVGVDYDFDPHAHPHIINRKIAYGTHNFLHEAAMNETDYKRCLAIGAEMVDECHHTGCNIISFGEMGIGNTSPSSILMSQFLSLPLVNCVGAGSGLDSAGVQHKLAVLQQAVNHYERQDMNPWPFQSREWTETTIRYFAGFEMVAAIGAMIRAAEQEMVILVDGFIMTSCMLAASQLAPHILDYAIFGHCGDEGGHKLMLNKMNAQPLLYLDMRLGEGTGALCAYPIVQSAVNMINEMDNFAHAEITKYF